MATGRETRVGNIPDLVDTSPRGIRMWAKNVVDALGTWMGTRAQTRDALLDQAVTFRDLIEQEFAIEAPAGTDKIVLPGTDEGAFSKTPPPAPTNFVVTRLPYNIQLTWDRPTYSNHAYTEIWRSTTNNLTSAEVVDRVYGSIALYNDTYLDAAFYWIRFVSLAGVAGAYNAISGTSGDSQPGDVTGLSYTLEEIGIRLRWNAIADSDLESYELRVGSTWESGVLIDRVRATSYLWRIQTTGTYRVWLRARDVAGFYSGSASSIEVIIAPPAQTNLSFFLSGDSIVLSWLPVVGAFIIDFYEIRYGNTWAGGTVVSRSATTAWVQRVDWSGVRRFWVAAHDVAGNYATPISVDVTIIPPGEVVSFTAEVIDNNVLLRWTAPTAGTLPIATYELRRGATFDTATVIGTKSGDFTTVFEQASGDYTYWIRPEDTAGTFGAPRAVTTRVNQPPDFILYDDLNANLADATLSNALRDATGIVLPFNTTETYDDHYSTRSWANDQAGITAGFPVYAQPVPTTGYFEFEFDYGVPIPATSVIVNPTLLVIAGSPTHVIQIDHKLNSGDSWTALTAGPSGYISTPFQFIRVRLTATTSASGVGLYRCTGLNIKLSVKLRTDTGFATGNAGDAGGTSVSLNLAFIDLIGPPTIQPVGTTPIIPVVDFVDVPNPTSFKVLLFDTSGTRVTAQFSWTARGI